MPTPNQRWSLDFVSDALNNGRRFRVLTVVDGFTRECLGLVVDTSLSGLRGGRELDRIANVRGRPAMIVTDNGNELTSHAILPWQEERGVLWHSRRRQAASPRCSTCTDARSRWRASLTSSPNGRSLRCRHVSSEPRCARCAEKRLACRGRYGVSSVVDGARDAARGR